MIEKNSFAYKLIGALVRFEPFRKLMISFQVWKQTRNHDALTLDKEYGIESSGLVSPAFLQSGKDADNSNRAFGSIQPELLRPVLGAIPNLAEYDFIDIGAGKAAAMIIASEFPFKSVSGIELSRYLCEIAEKNLAIVRKKFPGRVPMSVIEGDASNPDLPDGPVVIGFMNSFYGEPLDNLLARLVRHAEKHEVLFIYFNPIEWKVMDKIPAFSRWLVQPCVLPGKDGDEDTCSIIWRAAPQSQPSSQPLSVGAPLNSSLVINGFLSSVVAA